MPEASCFRVVRPWVRPSEAWNTLFPPVHGFVGPSNWATHRENGLQSGLGSIQFRNWNCISIPIPDYGMGIEIGGIENGIGIENRNWFFCNCSVLPWQLLINQPFSNFSFNRGGHNLTFSLLNKWMISWLGLKLSQHASVSLISTRGKFWPTGIVVACVCLCVCVHPYARQSLACPRDNSGPIHARITKLEQRCKRLWSRSLLWGGGGGAGWQLTLTFKVKFNLRIYPILSLSAP